MNFPPFWARGTSGHFSSWRWSFASLADAQAQADQAAQRLAERFGAGERPAQHAGYYPDRPLREPVLQEIQDPSGATAAVVTRNSYGCLVLNTARAMFVDIDLPEQKPAGLFARIFGGSGSAKQLTPEAAIAKVEIWTRANPGWGWRIYRTRAGLRLLATHDLMNPDSEATDAVFEALDSDPLYRRLCKAQKCFRARLTPKPWRCGVHLKPPRWPFENDKLEKWSQKWEAQYNSFAAGWATCQFVRAIGNPEVHPEIAPLVKLHDEKTRVLAQLKLA
jgi:hypothetical protein